ncbi:MAG: Stk1 family PASTA domain-containing Ser/Thr kinase [Tissierellia bacterium]|nr:Stk1 family PASTA domain-containing Ser/Thr kinase [Tissierellia bacterium]
MIGKTLGNRYYIEEKVGIGGMAKVYKAKDTILNRYVAVKVLKDQYMDDDDFLKKFAMEAQSAASISHPNIVSVYDVGSSSIDNKKYNYIVMEFVNGTTLKEIIQKEGPLDPDEVAKYGVQIAEALDCAHRNNIIHRDIKPQNMLIDSEGNLKVTDFGIARIASTSTITYTSTVLGTVHYISPEQAKGKFIDEKSDIYSLGVVLYEMATGRVPYDASNAVGIALKHIQDDLIPPKEYNDGIPDGLNQIIIKALEKDSADRFISASEIKEALEDYRNFYYISQDTEKTAKIGENIEDQKTLSQAVYPPKKKITESVYTMDSNEDDEEEKKPSFFVRYILPVLLAFLVFMTFLFGRSIFKKNSTEDETVEIKVPIVVNLEEDKAVQILEEQGLKTKIDRIDNADIREGLVISQDPEQNTLVEEGSTVTLEVSNGQTEVSVPNLAGLTIENARVELRKFDLNIGEISKAYSDSFGEGQIIDHAPAYGAMVSPGQKVDIVISKGKEDKKVEMIQLIGSDIRNASIQLEKIGLHVGTIDRRYDDEIEEDHILWQQFREGTTLEEGSTVDLIVSRGPKESNEEKPNNESDDNPSSSNTVGSKKKKYNFNIIQPVQEGEYKVTIIKVKKNGDEIKVYEDMRSASEGDITISLEDERDAKFKIYINDVLAETN